MSVSVSVYFFILFIFQDIAYPGTLVVFNVLRIKFIFEIPNSIYNRINTARVTYIDDGDDGTLTQRSDLSLRTHTYKHTAAMTDANVIWWMIQNCRHQPTTNERAHSHTLTKNNTKIFSRLLFFRLVYFLEANLPDKFNYIAVACYRIFC